MIYYYTNIKRISIHLVKNTLQYLSMLTYYMSRPFDFIIIKIHNNYEFFNSKITKKNCLEHPPVGYIMLNNNKIKCDIVNVHYIHITFMYLGFKFGIQLWYIFFYIF